MDGTDTPRLRVRLRSMSEENFDSPLNENVAPPDSLSASSYKRIKVGCAKTLRAESPPQIRALKKSCHINHSRNHAKKTHSHSRSFPLLPVRRSKREKRLVFANFTPQEIDNTILNRSAIIDESSEDELEPYEKLLSPVSKKRSRAAVTRYSLRGSTATVPPLESHSPPPPAAAADNEKNIVSQSDDIKPDTQVLEEQEEEQEQEEEEEEEEEDDLETSYNLRKRRPVVYQYQPVIQVVEETAHKKSQSNSRKHSYSYQSSAPSAYQPRRRNSAPLRHRTHQGSSTSSSGEDSDEARFQRRKKRSMKRARTECLPMNYTHDDTKTGLVKDRARIGASLADVNPMSIDRETTFDSIGGLKHHIRSLKEMIVFPLLYPEVFESFHISPPRGVLFHGPPGCGKTLVARALANECSKEGRKVAFFMRKGADCLSKWVGESERQLRLLFDQAYQMRPSIIFFDEIDGLAPVRSTRQDQIHSSIVSTLLALMDGLDSRGEIVVIGATNRIDAIDPALRRPGRFDREFRFPLPSRDDRYSILQIHTRPWNPSLKPEFIQELADHTVGYCGADLKALCTEAALHSLRCHYPQIYTSSDKLLIDVSTIRITADNFSAALRTIVPTAQRSNVALASSLSDIVFPLLGSQFEAILNKLVYVFPPAWKGVSKTLPDLQRRFFEQVEHQNGDVPSTMSSDKAEDIAVSTTASDNHRIGSVQSMSNSTSSIMSFQSARLANQLDGVFFDLEEMSLLTSTGRDDASITQPATNGDESSCVPANVCSGRFLTVSSHPHSLPPVHRPCLLLAGLPDMGQSDHLAPAVLNVLEDIPVQVLDSSVLYSSSIRSPEEALLQLFREARQASPSVVYVPRIMSWWRIATDSLQGLLLSVIKSLPPDLSVLVLATAECQPNELPVMLRELFSDSTHSHYTVSPPSLKDRHVFLHRILLEAPRRPPPNKPVHSNDIQHVALPKAPSPPPRELSEVEIKSLSKQREAVLRELRVFLRDATNKLLAERKFKEFTKPVDTEEVPDYFDIVKNPMDLSTIMKKIDERYYSVPKQWLDDIDQITVNALEYNPEHDSDSRLLRHRAVALQDLAHSIFDHELSEDFEKQCNEIHATFQRLGKEPPNTSPLRRNSSYTTSIATPINATSAAGYSKQKQQISTSVTCTSEPTRRSLRKLGINPESSGFPYYSPSKTTVQEAKLPVNQFAEETVAVVNEGVHTARRLNFQDNNSSSNSTQDKNTCRSSCDVFSISSGCDNPLDVVPPLQDSSNDVINSVPVTTSPSPPPVLLMSQQVEEQLLVIDEARLHKLFQSVLSKTQHTTVDSLLQLYSRCTHINFRHRMKWDRTELVEDLEKFCHSFLS